MNSSAELISSLVEQEFAASNESLLSIPINRDLTNASSAARKHPTGSAGLGTQVQSIRDTDSNDEEYNFKHIQEMMD